MIGFTTGDERRQCPREYQEHINRIGGFNRFGKPNFKLVWGQSETQTIYGQMAGGSRGAHIILQFSGVPAWCMMEWKPPETFGTPMSWYRMTWDPEAEVHALGEYPWRGLYIPATFSLYVKRVVGGGIYYDAKGEVVEKPSKLVIDAMPLAHWVIDLIVPNMRKSMEMTHLQKVTILKNREEAEKRAFRNKAMDAYVDAAPAWGGGASSKESNREAWMERLKRKQRGMKLSAEDIQGIIGKGHGQISGIRRK
jgi:hypothetical protein